MSPNRSPVWQVTAYPNLPKYLDYWVIRKIFSVVEQAKVIFRTIFPAQISPSSLESEQAFWKDLPSKVQSTPETPKTGSGALTSQDVIERQRIYPNAPDPNAPIYVLYNYAPLQTGGERIHFLLIPNSTKPAKNFLELDREQYVSMLEIIQKISSWARSQFGEQNTIHLFDKTGEIAGQTQPLFHMHLIVIQKKEEELLGRIAMLFRMLLPPRPLSKAALQDKVDLYKEQLKPFSS